MLLTEVKNPTDLKLTKSDTDGIWLHFEIDGEGSSGIRLETEPEFPNRVKWAERQFELAEGKAPTDKAPEMSAGRALLSAEDINLTIQQLQLKVRDRLNEKGSGILISRHEMLGIITEEFHELVLAVEGGSLADVEDELVDIAVAGIVSIASIKTGGVEW